MFEINNVSGINSVQDGQFTTGLNNNDSKPEIFHKEPYGYDGTPSDVEFIDEKAVKVKGDDGEKYKGKQLISRETDSSGRVWNITETSYTNRMGQVITDTVRTYVQTKQFDGQNVDITTTISVHKTPDETITREAEDSKYHHKSTTTTNRLVHDGNGSYVEIETETEGPSSKVKMCKIPQSFKVEYLRQTSTIYHQ